MKWSLPILLIVSLWIPTLSFGDEPSEPKIDQKTIKARLEVVKAKVSGKGYFVDIQFRIHGGLKNPSASINYWKSAYVIEESTGEKFPARRFARIGTLGQKRLDEGLITLVRIDNTRGKIKKDSRITFVVGGLRQEHVVVEE